MPYKDKEAQREATRRAVQKHRKGITQNNNVIPSDPGNVIPELLHRTNGADYDPDEVIHGHTWYPGGTLRYVPCHDGQALDRLTTPNP